MMGTGSFDFTASPLVGRVMARGDAYHVGTWLVGLSGLVLASLSRLLFTPFYTGQLPASPTQL